MELTGLILLTYQCNLACDHCFVWSHNWQTGTLTIEQLDDILSHAEEIPSIRSVFCEGGEPFLYYALLKHGV
ncbi:MAG TPA: radical SAM protein, partial [Candidatus Latescibacteria bacterium]|nr:radical SAM protein [Candidatus Latescibacterota bacterium]